VKKGLTKTSIGGGKGFLVVEGEEGLSLLEALLVDREEFLEIERKGKVEVLVVVGVVYCGHTIDLPIS
jgi:hypothetical protein